MSSGLAPLSVVSPLTTPAMSPLSPRSMSPSSAAPRSNNSFPIVPTLFVASHPPTEDFMMSAAMPTDPLTSALLAASAQSPDLLSIAVADAVTSLFSLDAMQMNPILALEVTAVPSHVCPIPPRWKTDVIFDDDAAFDIEDGEDSSSRRHERHRCYSSSGGSSAQSPSLSSSPRPAMPLIPALISPGGPLSPVLGQAAVLFGTATTASKLRTGVTGSPAAAAASPRSSPSVHAVQSLPLAAATASATAGPSNAATASTTSPVAIAAGASTSSQHPATPVVGGLPLGVAPTSGERLSSEAFGQKSLLLALNRLQLPESATSQSQRIQTLCSRPGAMAALQFEKKRVKEELKNYDFSFRSVFGTLPNKKQKEPMRPLYAYYKRIRSYLLQRDSRGTSGATVAEGDANHATSGAVGNKGAVPGHPYLHESSGRAASAASRIGGNSAASDPTGRLLSRNRSHSEGSYSAERNRLQQSAHSLSLDEITSAAAHSDLAEDTKRLQKLEEQKHVIGARLQAYQDEFLRTYSRKIHFHKDILPMEGEYKKYKQLREQINKLSDSIRRRQRQPSQSTSSGSGTGELSAGRGSTNSSSVAHPTASSRIRAASPPAAMPDRSAVPEIRNPTATS